MRDLAETVARFSSLHAVVLGEAMLDTYLIGSSNRLCREAPVPIVDVEERVDAPGGAANTAANVRALGASTSFLTVFGDDANGDRLLACLADRGVRTDRVMRTRSRETLAKQRIVVEPQLLVRFDEGSTAPLDARLEAELLARLRAGYGDADVVIISDYGYGIVTDAVVDALAHLQQTTPQVLVIDSKTPGRFRDAGVTAVKPNFSEARRLLHDDMPPGDRVTAVLRKAPDLLRATGARYVAVTLDHEGAVVLDREGASYRTFAERSPDSRAAGAGDTYVAGLALALGAGASMPEAAEIASAAAQVVVARDGTTTCDGDELRAAIAGGGKRIADREVLRSLIRAHRQAGRRIVFTNGCFDIMHRGHVTYLSQAKALGDVLIVGLNDDDSVRRLKGAGRPVNSLEDRAQVLAALSCVDYVTSFAEDTPEELIRLLVPDVVAKGGDYTRETLPEATLIEALGGEVTFLPYVDDRSTSGLIERIRASQALGLANAG